MVDRPLQEDLNQWKVSDESKWFLQNLAEIRSLIHSTWETGGYTAESSEGTLQLNAEALGMVKMLDAINDFFELEESDD